MKAYKVRHKESGLWYTPGKTNLSEKGKIYTNKNTVLSSSGNYSIGLTVYKKSRIYTKYMDKFKTWDESRYGDYVIAYFTKDDFELVEIKLNL